MVDAIKNKLGRGFARARALTVYDWRLLAIAVKELAFARFRHAVMPAPNIIAELQNSPALTLNPQSRPPDLARLSWAVAAAAYRVPWRADCLLQAMAANRWLSRHGIKSEFFVGVDKDAKGALRSHAWLMCRDRLITGPGYERFAVMIGGAEPCTSSRSRPLTSTPSRASSRPSPSANSTVAPSAPWQTSRPTSTASSTIKTQVLSP